MTRFEGITPNECMYLLENDTLVVIVVISP